MNFKASIVGIAVAAALSVSAFAADPIRIGVDGPPRKSTPRAASSGARSNWSSATTRPRTSVACRSRRN